MEDFLRLALKVCRSYRRKVGTKDGKTVRKKTKKEKFLESMAYE